MIDTADIIVEAGKGGDGAVSFRREKYVPKGGPDGGDGGKGADVYFRVDAQLSTLTDFARLKQFHADDGKPGGKNLCSGKSGDDLILYVPMGTEIYKKYGDRYDKIFDMTNKDQSLCIVRGGNGGWGNTHFKSATNQTPREANPGMPGEHVELRLNLKLIADVGVIGLPNVGKSTFLSNVTHSKPKIADYPFTTLEPNLGVCTHKGSTFVIADIPGLIEGASHGKGLGITFLRHIERTRLLVHFISADSIDFEKDYQTVRNELHQYSPKLTSMKEIVVLSRYDLTLDSTSKQLHVFIKKHSALTLSYSDPKSITNVLDTIIKFL